METSFGPRLKELRIAAGMTQKQLAEAAGLSQGSLANIEQGLREPAWGSVVALCQALGVKCDTFMEAPASTATPAGRGRPPKAPSEPESDSKVDVKDANRKRRKGKSGK